MKNNMLIISSKFHPDKDGLSSYTTILLEQLRAISPHYFLLTSHHYKTEKDYVFPIVKTWKFSHLKKCLNELNQKNSFNEVLIQYVPSMYGKKGGINFSILVFFIYLRFFKKVKVSFMFHELFFPFSFHLKYSILHLVHKIMFITSLNCSNRAFFSTGYFLQRAKKFNFVAKEMIHLPIGSNIINNVSEQSASVDEKLKFVMFGSSHPSKNYNLVFQCFEEIFKQGENFELLILGPSKEDLISDCVIPKRFFEYTQVLEKVSDQFVANTFSSADCIVAYFTDGITTRRSSVISALYYGLPVITTRNSHTDSVFLNRKNIYLLPTAEEEFKSQFIRTTEKLAKVNFETRSEIKSFYRDYFDWSITTKLLTKD